jgi:hypothetical protein
MRPPFDPDALERWLAAERSAGLAGPPATAGGEAADAHAEAAFAELLAVLPPPVLPAGFADRVMARTGFAAAAVPIAAGSPAAAPARARHRGARRLGAAWRWLVIAPFLLPVAWLLAWLPAVARGAALVWSLSDLVQSGLRLVLEIIVSLAPALVLGQKLVRFASALGTTLMSPGIALAAGACLLVAGLAFHSLRAVLSSHRRWVYADPI